MSGRFMLRGRKHSSFVPLLLAACLWPGCARSWIALRSDDVALQRNEATLRIRTRDSATIVTMPYFHVVASSPDSLRAFLNLRDRGDGSLDDADIEAMRARVSSAQPPDGGAETRAPADGPVLWCKGTRIGADGVKRPWLGAVAPADVASVSVEGDDYLRLPALRARLSGEYWIALRDGGEILGDSLTVRRDTTAFIDPATRLSRFVPTPAIAALRSHISPTRAFFSGVAGLIIGPLIFGFGPTLAIAAIAQPSGDRAMGLLIPLVFGGVAGAVIGPVIMYTSFMETYVFPP
jgi:hypothetical protein